MGEDDGAVEDPAKKRANTNNDGNTKDDTHDGMILVVFNVKSTNTDCRKFICGD